MKTAAESSLVAQNHDWKDYDPRSHERHDPPGAVGMQALCSSSGVDDNAWLF